MLDNFEFALDGWMMAVFLLLVATALRKGKNVGLSCAYVMEMTSIHWLGAWVYSLPWYVPPHYAFAGAEQVVSGFLLSFKGLLAFLVGNILVAPIFISGISKVRTNMTASPVSQKTLNMYFLFGMFIYFGPGAAFARIPSFATIWQSSWILIAVCIELFLWQAYQKKKRGMFLGWFIFGMIFFPAITLLLQGFLGFGVKIVILILCFIAAFYRPRWKTILGGIVATWFGLTLTMNYLSVRGSFREQVWGGGSMSDRVQVITNAVKNARSFDWKDQTHLEYLDLRFNQNAFVGNGISYITSGYVGFAKGKTIGDAVISIVPRILWPNKPTRAGSGNLVADYTGATFDETTSFGVGQVLEFYINYGTPCVLIGFFIIGIILAWIDQRCAVFLYAGDLSQFVKWMLPGLGLINVGGSLVETVGASVSALVFVYLVKIAINPPKKKFKGLSDNR